MHGSDKQLPQDAHARLAERVPPQWASRGMQWEMDVIVTSNEAHCGCRTRVQSAFTTQPSGSIYNLMYLMIAPGDGRKTNEIRPKPAAAERGSRAGLLNVRNTKPNVLFLYNRCTNYGHRRTMSGTWLRSQDLELTNLRSLCAAVACFTSTTRSKSSNRFI
jgi:hypothetical protein